MLNHVEIQGRLTRDPEIATTSGGTKYCRFTVACDQDFQGQDGKRGCDFIDVVVWKGSADFVSRYFCKGDQILVAGRLSVQNYEDRNGVKRKKSEINAEKCYFCGSKRSAASGDPDDEAPLPPMEVLPDDTDLPF